MNHTKTQNCYEVPIKILEAEYFCRLGAKTKNVLRFLMGQKHRMCGVRFLLRFNLYTCFWLNVNRCTCFWQLTLF